MFRDHQWTGIIWSEFFDAGKNSFGPIRRSLLLLINITTSCFASVLWLQRGKATEITFLLAGLFSALTSFPVIYFIRYSFLSVSDFADKMESAPDHIHTMFMGRVRVVSIIIHLLGYLVIGFNTYSVVLISINLETNESTGWLLTNLSSVLVNALCFDPISIMLKYWYDHYLDSQLETDEIISETNIELNQTAKSSGIDLRLAAAALKDGMKRAQSDSLVPEEPDPVQVPMPKP